MSYGPQVANCPSHVFYQQDLGCQPLVLVVYQWFYSKLSTSCLLLAGLVLPVFQWQYTSGSIASIFCLLLEGLVVPATSCSTLVGLQQIVHLLPSTGVTCGTSSSRPVGLQRIVHLLPTRGAPRGTSPAYQLLTSGRWLSIPSYSLTLSL